jgi:hypothetical protein
MTLPMIQKTIFIVSDVQPVEQMEKAVPFFSYWSMN